MISVLGRHIDALYLSVDFDFPDHLKAVLAAAKDEAKQDDAGLALFAPPVNGIPGGPCYIRSKGRGKYQYVLENASFYAELTVWKNMPALKLQFKAATLYEYDPDHYEVLVGRFVRALVGKNLPCTHKVSRCDLAVDFQAPDFVLPEMADVVTRARDRTVHYKGDRSTALTLGKRQQALQAQIYNKSEELLVSDKGWMKEVWVASGNYDETLPVWRAELRFFREGLHAFDVRTLDDLLASLGDLASYTVGEGNGCWLRITDPASRGKQVQTRDNASWWSAVCGALRSGLLSSGRKRKGYDPTPSLDRCIKLAGSLMSRAAALHRIGYDSKTALDPARFAAWVGWQYQKRLALDGITWPDKVNAKTSDLRAVAWVA
jgi:hypothetical protein